jgi:hypothetical protein
MQQLPPASPNDPRTSLHQEVELAATASRIEGALLDAKQFAAFTGLAATIDAHEGGAFSLFGGLIVGRNIELVSGQRAGVAAHALESRRLFHREVRISAQRQRDAGRARSHRIPRRRIRSPEFGVVFALLGSAEEALRLSADSARG